MEYERESWKTICNKVVSEKYLEQVDEFVYLGGMLTRDGKVDRENKIRVLLKTPLMEH